jgi:hypothetical protein
VFAAYFQEESIGDVGGKNAKYVPKRGYPGTLAPGENFKEDNPIDELPKRVLHPWPAMQQFQYHVRWPPAHPMLPPPLLFFALNNMYTDNYTSTELGKDTSEVVGGLYMEPGDSMRIARDGVIGNCYEQKDQIPHGGMLFPGRHLIPNYNPDHGPTIPLEEARPPIPRELLPFAERWVDPYFNLEQLTMKEAVSAELLPEAQAEEEKRRKAAEKMLKKMDPVWVAQEAAVKEEIELEVIKRLAVWEAANKKKLLETKAEMTSYEMDSTDMVVGADGSVTASAESGGSPSSSEDNNEGLAISTRPAPVREDPRDVEERRIRRDIEKERAIKEVVGGK